MERVRGQLVGCGRQFCVGDLSIAVDLAKIKGIPRIGSSVAVSGRLHIGEVGFVSSGSRPFLA